MLFTRWQHHLRFVSGFPYAPLKAMVTKVSKWSRIQDSFRITPKIESLVVFAIPDIPGKFHKDPSIIFWVILLTHRQTNKVWQKHYLLSGGKNWPPIKLIVMSKAESEPLTLSTFMRWNAAWTILKLSMYSCSRWVLNLTFFNWTDPSHPATCSSQQYTVSQWNMVKWYSSS